MTENKRTNAFLILIMAAAFIGAAVISGFVCAADSAPLPIDVSVRDFFISLRSDVPNAVISAFTHCGDTVTIVGLCLLLLILPSRKTYGLPVTLSALGGLAIYKPMKHLFLRARPDKALHLVEQGGYSFPSGHSVSSVIVYGLLLYLIRKHCKNPVLKNVLTVICALLMVFIGPSRLYVSVHWATDVSCGMLIGLGVLMAAILILRKKDSAGSRKRCGDRI